MQRIVCDTAGEGSVGAGEGAEVSCIFGEHKKTALKTGKLDFYFGALKDSKILDAIEEDTKRIRDED